MIACGYALDLYCDCEECQLSRHPTFGEYVGQTYAECAKQAKADGGKLSHNKRFCAAPNHKKCW